MKLKQIEVSDHVDNNLSFFACSSSMSSSIGCTSNIVYLDAQLTNLVKCHVCLYMSTSDLLDEISWKSVLETESMEVSFWLIIFCEVDAFADVGHQFNKHDYRQQNGPGGVFCTPWNTTSPICTKFLQTCRAAALYLQWSAAPWQSGAAEPPQALLCWEQSTPAPGVEGGNCSCLQQGSEPETS